MSIIRSETTEIVELEDPVSLTDWALHAVLQAIEIGIR